MGAGGLAERGGPLSCASRIGVFQKVWWRRRSALRAFRFRERAPVGRVVVVA